MKREPWPGYQTDMEWARRNALPSIWPVDEQGRAYWPHADGSRTYPPTLADKWREWWNSHSA